MKVNPEILRSLAAALNEIDPDHLWATASPDVVRLRGGGASGVGASHIDVRSVQTDAYMGNEMEVDAYALLLLDNVQELMIEEVRGGWPPVDPSRPRAPQSAGDLPGPTVEVVGDELSWWFGDRKRPSLRIQAVRLPSDERIRTPLFLRVTKTRILEVDYRDAATAGSGRPELARFEELEKGSSRWASYLADPQ